MVIWLENRLSGFDIEPFNQEVDGARFTRAPRAPPLGRRECALAKLIIDSLLTRRESGPTEEPAKWLPRDDLS